MLLKNYKIIIFILLFFLTKGINAQENNTLLNTWSYYNSKDTLGGFHNKNLNSNKSIGLSFVQNKNSISSNLSINLNADRKIRFNDSFIQKKIGILTFGIGKVKRNWSFSPNTSLILSSNAEPLETVYFKLDKKRRSNKPFSRWLGPWSLEIFNGATKDASNEKKIMLTGVRAIFSPTSILDLSIYRTSQWGGEGYNTGIKGFKPALLANTNEGDNNNINQMAGFGFSFDIPEKLYPGKIHGQVIGEDEAGSLPSCLIHLIGAELYLKNINYPTTLGTEFVDTRVDTSTHGHCGPNTAYNNKIYKYTNNNLVMGAPIDSEGTSFEVYAKTRVSSSLSIKYSLKNITINDVGIFSHRLSTKKETGLSSYAEVNWQKNNININTKLTYQNFSLNKTQVKNGIGLGIYAAVKY
jgi:hypothetical protein